MRRWLLALFCFFALIGPVRADAPYLDAPSGDVLIDETLNESLLPPPPAGYRSMRRAEVKYVVPEHFVDDLDELERHRVEAWTTIGNDLGVALPASLIIRIARKPEEMFAMAPIGFPPPSYASGVAYPSMGLIMLTITTHDPNDPTPDLERVLTHELSHVALHRAAGGRPIPRWFSEGVAIHHSIENGIERMRTLWEGDTQDRLAKIPELSARFADGSPDVSLAYAQSADIVAFMLRSPRAPDRMRRMLTAIREGADFDAAMNDAFGFDTAGLERQWREDLDTRNTSYPILLGGGSLWALVVVALAIGWVRKRSTNRATLRRWAKEEAAVDSLEAELLRKLEEAEREAAARRDAELEAESHEDPDDESPGNRTLH